jgi:hypothetical protein
VDPIAAKQFLISRVIEEAELEHIPLSEVERKMLSFTEVHPSLPDIYEVNAEFEGNYDSDEYESKIAELLKSARDRDRKRSPDQDKMWKDVLDALRDEDHYILVMVGQAFGVGAASSGGGRFRDVLVYVVGITIVLFAVLVVLWKLRH